MREQAENPAKLLWLAEELRQLVEDMQSRRIAHGDLQHANLIVDGERLLLVDYDGVYVPCVFWQPIPVWLSALMKILRVYSLHAKIFSIRKVRFCFTCLSSIVPGK